MTPKKSALQALSVVTTVGLALGAAPAIADEGGGAKDLFSDNTHNIAGGGVNIHADNTCVEKIGDTAHVKFEVQHQPLMRSSHRHETSADGFIALPKSLKNVKIGIKAVADDAGVKNEDGDYVAGNSSIQRSVIYDTPVDMPVVDYEDDPEAPAMLGGSPGKYQTEDERARGYEDRGFSRKTDPNPKDPGTVVEHWLPTEQELRDHIKKFDVHMRKITPDPTKDYWEEGAYNGPFSDDTGLGMWYGNNIADYNIYEFGSLFLPTSFEIEADVVVEHDDTFVTGAVSNLGKKHFDEVRAGMADDGFELNGVLLGNDGWARPGFLPPAIPSDPKMIEIYKDKLTDAGLDISPRMVPTAEMSGDSKYLRIGTDIHPSERGDVGYAYYMRDKLIENRAVTYIGQVPRSGEDGADITAAHVTLCSSEDTPETETPDKETETPDKETETPDKETETSETETPETETEKEPTPSTEPKPNGSSLDEETIKKVGIGLGLGLGGSALIKKVKEHRGGSSSAEHTTSQPTPSTTKQPAPTTTVQPAPSTTAQPAPSTTEQAAPAPSTSPAPAATTSKTGTLAQTGANVTTLAVVGSLIVLAGAAFLLVGRRRKEEN